MMRNYILILFTVMLPFVTFGQNKSEFDAFMEQYSSFGWDNSLNGKPIKSFSMKTPEGKQLDSEKLKGKVVVLDFWATWCGACVKLTHEMDSLLSKYYNRDFQMIGVNFQESIKYRDPVKYWEKKGYNFPMTVDCDSYGKAVDAGNPTVFVIDQNGIVRGKWNGWTSYTAAEIELLVWTLLDAPEISVQAAVDENRSKNYIKALYLCDAAAAKNPDDGVMLARDKFRALLHIDEFKAFEFAEKWRASTNDSEQTLIEIGVGIAEIRVLNSKINAYGAETFETLIKRYNYGENLILQDFMGRCYFRAGEKEKAITAIKKSIEIAQKENAHEKTMTYLKGVLKSYQEEK